MRLTKKTTRRTGGEAMSKQKKRRAPFEANEHLPPGYYVASVASIVKMLHGQMEHCKRPGGVRLLAALKGHIEGTEVVAGCETLAEAADAIDLGMCDGCPSTDDAEGK